tara:strand:- start:16213 stop:16443 length:231 start_codon:yes stop_codon:yes gene_type:complete
MSLPSSDPSLLVGVFFCSFLNVLSLVAYQLQNSFFFIYNKDNSEINQNKSHQKFGFYFKKMPFYLFKRNYVNSKKV